MTQTFLVDFLLADAGDLDCDNFQDFQENTGFANGVLGSATDIDLSDNRACGEIEEEDRRATFKVIKLFSDRNPMEIEATLDCNSGLIPVQTTNVAPGQNAGHTFVLVFFSTPGTDCQITETDLPGYTTTYTASGDSVIGDESDCFYENVQPGDENLCVIFNDLDPVTVTVHKVWFDEHLEFNNSLWARAHYDCVGEQNIFDSPDHFYSNTLWFHGLVDSDTFDVWPHWNGLTWCYAEERVKDSSVDSDDSECEELPVRIAEEGIECTIYNTRIYEGIPTLNQYGLALLALLMLGIGVVGLRRFA